MRKLDSKGLYTMMNKDHTWQRMGEVESPKERPATRREILALHAYFNMALDLSDRMIRFNGNNSNTKPATSASTSGLTSNSEMEQDILAVKEDVRQLLAGLHTSAANNNVVGGRSSDLTTHSNALAAAFFEFKWTDVVFGQAVSQISIMCHEHGQLLRQVRQRVAASFAALKQVHFNTIHQLDDASKLAEQFNADLQVLRQEQETYKVQLADQMKEDVARVAAGAQQKYDDYEEQLREAELANARMSDTLATYNNIFRNMREDAEAVRKLDFVDTTAKLESRLQQCHKELAQLRPLKAKLKEAEAYTELRQQDIEELRNEVSKLHDDLKQRDAMVQRLMQHASKQFSAAEVAASSSPSPQPSSRAASRKGKRPKSSESTSSTETQQQQQQQQQHQQQQQQQQRQADEQQQQQPAKPKVVASNLLKQTDTAQVKPLDEWAQQNTPGAAKVIRDGMDERTGTIMCARCNAALDQAGNIDDLIGEQNKRKLPCAGYRILLPNLIGYRPERPRCWVLRVMRCIIRSKRVLDFRAERDGCFKMRFPEFVHAWFAPPRHVIEDISKEGRLKLHAEADEHRWGLYYGVKALAEELPEARIFFNLLDEKHGEDELAFYLHLLAVAENEVVKRGEVISWGILCNAPSFHALQKQFYELGSEPDVDDFAWIQVKHAAEVVKLVMKNSTPADKQKTLKRLAACAIQQQTSVLQAHNSVNKMVDVHVCIRILLKEFHEEQAHRRAALRLMFKTVSTAGAEEQSVNRGLDMQQLTSIVESLNPRSLPSDPVMLFRLAHEQARGKVDFESFCDSASRINFFSRCLRLPVHFGAELASGLTKVQCAQLGEVVRKHAALLGTMLDDFADTFLQDQEVVRMRQLYADVCGELAQGRLVLDGRRAFCALRRLLEFMLRRRMDVHEQIGDTVDADRLVFMADKELSALASVVTNFEMDDRRRKLNAVQEKNSASLIQRKWRQKHVDNAAVPAPMRRLLSAAFEPKIKPKKAKADDKAARVAAAEKRSSGDTAPTTNGATTDDMAADSAAPDSNASTAAAATTQVTPARLSMQIGHNDKEITSAVANPVRRIPRTVARPVEWVLLWIDLVYRHKMIHDLQAIQRKQFVQIKGRVSKPPVPPPDALRAARGDVAMTIHQAVLEVMLQRFGVRTVAERQVHDLFINVHRHAKTHPRVRLFAAFTGMRTTALRNRRGSLEGLEGGAITTAGAAAALVKDKKSRKSDRRDKSLTSGGKAGATGGAKQQQRHQQQQQQQQQAQINGASAIGRLMLAEDPMGAELSAELSHPSAIDTYLVALSLITTGNGPLFPEPDSSNASFVSLEASVIAMKALFSTAGGATKHRPCGTIPSSRTMEEALNCLEKVESKGKVDCDRFLMSVMQAWVLEARLRHAAFDHIAEVMQSRLPIDKVLSLSDFEQHLVPHLLPPTPPPAPETILFLYHEVLAAIDPAQHITPELLKDEALAHICRWRAVPADFKSLNVPFPSAGLSAEWRLLEYTWNPFKDVLAGTIHELRTQNEAESESWDESDDGYFDFKDMEEAFKVTVEDIEKIRAMGDKIKDEGVVLGAWNKVCDLFGKLQRVRVRVGLGAEPLEDAWDKNAEGGGSCRTQTNGRKKSKVGGGKKKKSKRSDAKQVATEDK